MQLNEVKKWFSKSNILIGLLSSGLLSSGSLSSGLECHRVKEVQEQGMLDSVGQPSDTVDETMLVKPIDNPTPVSVTDSDLRTVLIKNRLAHTPKNLIVHEQSVTVPKRQSNFGSESKAQG